jgi:sugar-specific transcriptional regulator TrmB
MYAFETEVHLLRDFGLTSKQAKVYLTAARLKPMTPINQISRESRVGMEDVYRAITDLERVGLIEKIPDVPIKIKSKSLDEGLLVLIARQKENAERRISFLLARRDEILRNSATGFRNELDEWDVRKV